MEADEVLLVSGFGDHGGGLFTWSEGKVEQLDELSSTGIAVAGDRLARLLRSPTDLYGSELLVYDERGVQRYTRLDEVLDPHDVVWDGWHYVVASTSANSVFWLSPAGELVRHWTAPGEGDAWHLNSLHLAEGELYAAAFGYFERHREWNDHKDDGTGMVFNLRTRTEVLSGLFCPHHPRLVDDSWIVCNSAAREILELDRQGRLLRQLELRSWTRGLAVDDRVLYVGESALRKPEAGQAATASVAIVSRDDWTVIESIELPCDEVYDVHIAPRSLIEGLRRGFRTNPVRMASQSQASLLDEVGVQPDRESLLAYPLPPEACRATINASLPTEIAPDSWHELPCRIGNCGTASFVSAPPNPVHISYRWLNGGTVVEGLRSLLPHAIVPSMTADCRLGLLGPSVPGDYELQVTLVQEGVAWFVDLDPTSALQAKVKVVEPRSGS